MRPARLIALVAAAAAVLSLTACSSSSSPRPSMCAGPGGAASASGLGTPPAGAAVDRASRSAFVTRDRSALQLGGRPWRFSGVNMYWLGLDDNVTDSDGPMYPSHAAVDNGFCSAVHLGARVVRSTSLGVSVGSPRTLEPSFGQFNDAAFASIDYAVADARRYGLRLMIPLTDQNHYYTGGTHTFTDWLGQPEANFYTDPKVIAAFEGYISHVLDHVNPLTGIRLGDDPTVAIWETGNEVYDAPPTWTEQIAAFIKSKAPHALVADGSAASGKDITQTGADQPDVDIIDAHFYPTDTGEAGSEAAYVAAKGKAYMVGEYPLTGGGLAPWLSSLAGDHDVAGDLAWSLLPYDANGDAEQHGDGYTFHFPAATPAEKPEVALLARHARQMSRA